MKEAVWAFVICVAFIFAHDNRSFAEQGEPSPSSTPTDKQAAPQPPRESNIPVDILTDTKGTDLHPYLAGVLPKIKANWDKSVPESIVVQQPSRRRGSVVIGFRITKSGRITKVELQKSSGDIAKDRAAWAGVAWSDPLPPLPPGFACNYVVLHIHFYYFPEKGEVAEEKEAPTLPCVTTTIRPAPEQ